MLYLNTNYKRLRVKNGIHKTNSFPDFTSPSSLMTSALIFMSLGHTHISLFISGPLQLLLV